MNPPTKILCVCISVTVWRFSWFFIDEAATHTREKHFDFEHSHKHFDAVIDFVGAKTLSADSTTIKTPPKSESSEGSELVSSRGDHDRIQEKNRSSHLNTSILEKIPDALQIDPSSLRFELNNDAANCCVLPSQRRRKRMKNSKANTGTCRAVCFAPEACNNRFYPYRDEKEDSFFRRRKDGNNDEYAVWKNETRSKCYEHKAPNQQPPNHWNSSSSFPFINDIPPLGCSLVSDSAGGSFQSLYIIPSAKLAFCGIAKVGITNWKMFIRFVMGAHDYPSFPHGKPDLSMWAFDRLEPDVQKHIWNDPEWTFAAFLRNPAERLLSAYLDKLKVEQRNGVIAKQLGFNESFTFDTFLGRLEKELPEDLNCRDKELKSSVTGISWCTDPHWRPQAWSCGMSEKIDRFDFIGSIDHAEKHSRALLERVGLWETHGRHYRNGRSKRTAGKFDQCVQLPPLEDELVRSSQHVGFQQKQKKQNVSEATAISKSKMMSWDTIGHAQGSSTKMDKYYTPELYRKVKEKLYRADFQLWDLLNRENGEWVSGRDMLPHLLNS